MCAKYKFLVFYNFADYDKNIPMTRTRVFEVIQ